MPSYTSTNLISRKYVRDVLNHHDIASYHQIAQRGWCGSSQMGGVK